MACEKKLSHVQLVWVLMLWYYLPDDSSEFMAQVAGVSDDLLCFHHTSLGVDVLEGGELTSNDVQGRLNRAFWLRAVPVPGGDAASQDALHSATVELSEGF